MNHPDQFNRIDGLSVNSLITLLYNIRARQKL